MNSFNDKRLFVACFCALVATSFGFIIRAMIMDDLAMQFGLSETQKGEIFGVGLWPFAVSIVLFSLVIDKIGYGKAMLFAFFCHAASIAITLYAPHVLAGKDATPEQILAGKKAGYWMLYLGNLIVALGNGTVEAVINPVVATMFARDKTKWLNILHAGWPGGLVLGGVLTIGIGALRTAGALPDLGMPDWQLKVCLLGIPVILYGLLMFGCTFPVNERVAAGVSYREMLGEVGFLGALVVTALITFEVTRVFESMELIFQGKQWSEVIATYDLPWVGKWAIEMKMAVKVGIIVGVSTLFGLAVLSLGRFMFFFLMLVMIPLAITELGTDTWITDLMKPEMKKLGIDAGWILVYTSLIMTILRFFAGPIVHRLSPLGLLAISSGIAAIGLVSLSMAAGVLILVAATFYGFGKTFFWPTMLGVVSEQFPKGGALTLNAISGVGMLGVGVVGAALLGNIQDKEVDKRLALKNPALYKEVVGPTKQSVFGAYQPLDEDKVRKQPEAGKEEIKAVQEEAKKTALFTVALFPCFMLASYLLLILYFKARGGYKAVILEGAAPAGAH